MKKLQNVCLFLLVNVFFMSMQSCSEQDVFTVNENGTLHPKTCSLNMNVEIDAFDKVSTRATGTWKVGDKIFLTLGNGAYGIAEYKNNEWKVEYFGDLITDSIVKCTAVYFENIDKTENFSKVYLAEKTAIYEDTDAQYTFSDNMLGITAKLTPKTGRVRFKGTAKDTIHIYGVTTLTEYSVYKSEYQTELPLIKLAVGSDGYTSYVYGMFADTLSRRINVITKKNAFNRVFADSVMTKGVSGYLDVPTDSSHRAWAKNLVCKVNGCEFTMIPLIKNDTIAYFMGETEVTEGLYAAVSNKTTTKKNYPYEFNSYHTSNTFVANLNNMINLIFRVPTSKEWQYAAKGGNKSQKYTYSGSNSVSDVAWYSDNSKRTIHEVAQLMPNELGFYDMSGNLSEWTSSKYSSSSNYYYYFGGNYSLSSDYCKTSHSTSYASSSNYCGLRLALSIN